MARNVEIKAQAPHLADIADIANSLSNFVPEIMEQTDVFFHTEKGRLKLRIFSEDRGQLIYYERPNQFGPKTSTYSISITREPHILRNVLSAAYGEEIVVKKTRTLIIIGRTRVHLDEVDNLGNFVELEIVLEDRDNVEDAVEEAYSLMDKLGIAKSELVEGAYADLLRQEKILHN